MLAQTAAEETLKRLEELERVRDLVNEELPPEDAARLTASIRKDAEEALRYLEERGDISEDSTDAPTPQGSVRRMLQKIVAGG